MAVVHGPDSAYAKEMARWNAHHSEHGPPGRPYTYQEYPAMLYRLNRNGDGSRTMEHARVETDTERALMESRGFVAGGQGAAMEAFDAQEREYARLAAEREYEKVHTLSPKAVAEVNAVETAAGAVHLASIPDGSKRRGRKTNAERAAAAKAAQGVV